MAVNAPGFREFDAALKLLAPEIHEAWRANLRTVADWVANDARAWADAQGFTPPGRSGRGLGNLIGMIRTGVTQRKVYIVDRARAQSDEYPYPRLYEYARGRPFFHPAFDQNEGRIVAGVEAAIQQVIDSWSLL